LAERQEKCHASGVSALFFCFSVAVFGFFDAVFTPWARSALKKAYDALLGVVPISPQGLTVLTVLTVLLFQPKNSKYINMIATLRGAKSAVRGAKSANDPQALRGAKSAVRGADSANRLLKSGRLFP
jgi:hypothetical protein